MQQGSGSDPKRQQKSEEEGGTEERVREGKRREELERGLMI
jgi:hypothetical protein